jgi:hypothetical protein
MIKQLKLPSPTISEVLRTKTKDISTINWAMQRLIEFSGE